MVGSRRMRTTYPQALPSWAGWEGMAMAYVDHRWVILKAGGNWGETKHLKHGENG